VLFISETAKPSKQEKAAKGKRQLLPLMPIPQATLGNVNYMRTRIRSALLYPFAVESLLAIRKSSSQVGFRCKPGTNPVMLKLIVKRQYSGPSQGYQPMVSPKKVKKTIPWSRNRERELDRRLSGWPFQGVNTPGGDTGPVQAARAGSAEFPDQPTARARRPGAIDRFKAMARELRAADVQVLSTRL